MSSGSRLEPRVRKAPTQFDGAELPRVNKISQNTRVKALKTTIVDTKSAKTVTKAGSKKQNTAQKPSIIRKKCIPFMNNGNYYS